MTMSQANIDTAQTRPGFTRRGFLLRAAIGAAAVVGVATVLRRQLLKSGALRASPMDFDDDSIFKPRADALKRMLGRR